MQPVKPFCFNFDDLQLLAKAEINSDDLADPIQLKSIENRIKNKGNLNDDDMAILKLIRSASSYNNFDTAPLQTELERGAETNHIQDKNIQDSERSIRSLWPVTHHWHLKHEPTAVSCL